MKAIAYLRIAAKEITCPKDSFTYQEKSIQDFCIKKNIELAKVFTDIGSGLKNFQGKVWLELQDYIKLNQMDFILVADWDRLGRDSSLVLQKINDIQTANKTFVISINTRVEKSMQLNF